MEARTRQRSPSLRMPEQKRAFVLVNKEEEGSSDSEEAACCLLAEVLARAGLVVPLASRGSGLVEVDMRGGCGRGGGKWKGRMAVVSPLAQLPTLRARATETATGR